MPRKKIEGEKEREKREVDDDRTVHGLPPEFTSRKMHRPTSKGHIPVSVFFDGIYETAAKSEAKRFAPDELAQLKVHLDGALKQLQAMSRKMQEKREGPR